MPEGSVQLLNKFSCVRYDQHSAVFYELIPIQIRDHLCDNDGLAKARRQHKLSTAGIKYRLPQEACRV